METMSLKKISKQKKWDNIQDFEEQLLLQHQWERLCDEERQEIVRDCNQEEMEQHPQYYK